MSYERGSLSENLRPLAAMGVLLVAGVGLVLFAAHLLLREAREQSRVATLQEQAAVSGVLKHLR